MIDANDKHRRRWLREIQYVKPDRVSHRAAFWLLTAAVLLVWGVVMAVYVGFFR